MRASGPALDPMGLRSPALLGPPGRSHIPSRLSDGPEQQPTSLHGSLPLLARPSIFPQDTICVWQKLAYKNKFSPECFPGWFLKQVWMVPFTHPHGQTTCAPPHSVECGKTGECSPFSKEPALSAWGSENPSSRPGASLQTLAAQVCCGLELTGLGS